jgi:phosphoserine aminotransferase
MNVTFTLPNEELTKKFLAEANEKGFVGLAGHRSVGGCRASIYNAVPLEACEALAAFMNDFRRRFD